MEPLADPAVDIATLAGEITDEEEKTAPSVVNLGIPNAYIPQAKPDKIHARFGLDPAGIADTVRTAIAATPA